MTQRLNYVALACFVSVAFTGCDPSAPRSKPGITVDASTDVAVDTAPNLCGNGTLNGAEVCDDGNRTSGDGCNFNCTSIDIGYTCPTPGASCVEARVCGDSFKATSEACDDGNAVSGDGCNAECSIIEPNYSCDNPGQPCVLMGFCGDGMVTVGEVCDDGNALQGDGCAIDCMSVEEGFVCPMPGQLCQVQIRCGDGRLAATEACDDGNMNSNDGCSSSCTIESGYACPVVGVRCRAARCGDGIRVDTEACDDGNTANNDGCSSMCVDEAGYACPTGGGSCTRVTCGNGVREGNEPCDDGNNVLGDGCDPFCRREPSCTNGTCTAVCGDGVRLSAEACDDGNRIDGDGCSSNCVIETGFACTDRRAMEPSFIEIPIVYRDFRGTDVGGHVDFEGATNGLEQGLVQATLVNGRPARSSVASITISSAASFGQWYTDVAGVNRPVVDRLRLDRTAPNTYTFDDATFWPLDTRGFRSDNSEALRGAGDGNQHNFHFTSEVRYWFEYAGGEVLTFRGDDDVWVFINGRLAVDIGGVKVAVQDSVTLNSARATQLGLVVGGIYEAVVYQAERHTVDSSYRLTLAGFNAPKSVCIDTCGDGIVSRNEVCDDGTNSGAYMGCMPGCQAFAPRCGDAHVDPEHNEQCDDGFNTGGYAQCNSMCRFGPRCGDGTLQSQSGEQCDDGNVMSNDGCSATCQTEGIGPI